VLILLKVAKKEQGFAQLLVIGLVVVVLVVVGLAVWNVQKTSKRGDQAGQASPTPTAIVQAASPSATITPAPLTTAQVYAIANAAADKFCKTHPDYSGAINSNLVFKSSPVDSAGRLALYASNNTFVLLQGSCFTSAGAFASYEGGWVVKISSGAGEVVDITQESFHADKVQQYNIPPYTDFK
jgi:hypothetical protein